MAVPEWMKDAGEWIRFVTKSYLLLAPLFIVVGFYLNYMIEQGVQSGLESVLEKDAQQDEQISKLRSDHNTFKYQ